MPGYLVETISSFVDGEADRLIGALSSRLLEEYPGDHERQLRSWRSQIDLLQTCLSDHLESNPAAGGWGIIIEYPLLRLQRRLDVVILAGQTVAVLEFKVGAGSFNASDKRQVEDYALGLRDFHETSKGLSIWPVLVVTEGPHGALTEICEGVAEVATTNAAGLRAVFSCLSNRVRAASQEQLDVFWWDSGAYRPVPTIVQAAEALFAGHQVTEIAAAATDPKNLKETSEALVAIIEKARSNKEHVIAFVTGVPGSGKTLVGLNAVHDKRFSLGGASPGAYLSGNTPLVEVLKMALADDARKREGIPATEAARRVGSAVQSLMNFLREYLNAHPDKPPADHVVVFDEAQRAWDAEYGKQKFDRPKSEASLFLEIMGRHEDWAVIIALVGGGQEINRGELGLTEWGRALAEANAPPGCKQWRAVASPQVIDGDDSTAWQRLIAGERPPWLKEDSRLHLSSSVRSYGSEAVPRWVNALLGGDIQEARAIAREDPDFPVYVTRDLDRAREWLRSSARGHRRCGLVASSGARRIRADGLGVSLGATQLKDLAHWFLRDRGDIRSSFALEVVANEYGCQGLELDYVGVCWDGDLLWDQDSQSWMPRRLVGAKWQVIQQPDGKNWAVNKYRVLLTRARLGMVLWVPQGDTKDRTRQPYDYHMVVRSLLDAGARNLDGE